MAGAASLADFESDQCGLAYPAGLEEEAARRAEAGGDGAGAGVGFAGAGADTASGGFAVSSDTIEVFEVSSAGVAVSVCDNMCVSFSGSNAVVLGATRGLGAILGVGLGRLRADTNGNCAVWFGPVSFVLLLLAVIRPLVLGSTG